MYIFIPSHQIHPLLRPKKPRKRDEPLDRPRDPQIKLHPSRHLAHISAHDRAYEYAGKRERTPVPFGVSAQRRH